MGAALKPLLKRLAVGSPAALPTLDLDFLAQTYRVSDGAGGMSSVAFADLITFTRSSTAWRFNASGVLEQVTSSQPRFDYDPAALQPGGLLIEEQRTNLLIQSDDYSVSSWTKSLAAVESSSVVSPAGGLMQKLVDSTTNDLHSLYQICSITGSTAYCYSVHAKQGERRYVFLNIGSSRSQCAVAAFDLQTGTLLRTYNNGNTWAGIAAGVINCGNGVYRLWVSATSPAGATSGNPAIWLVSDGAVASAIPIYAGDGASGAYLWRQQFEPGAFPTSTTPTTSAQVTRAADVASVNTLSPWFNPDEGTLFVEGAPLSVAGPVKRAAAFTNGTQQNRIVLDLAANTGITEYLVTASGVSMASITSAAIGTAGTIRMAGVYGATDYRMAAKGALGTGTAPGGAVPAITKLELGALVGAQFFNGHIRRIRYWPRRLFDNELQRITA